MRHRIQTSYEADARGIDQDGVVKQLMEVVQVPAADAEQDPAGAERADAASDHRLVWVDVRVGGR